MPIRKVPGGYKWGNHGAVFPTREGAEKQAAAAYAHGYEGYAGGGEVLPVASLDPESSWDDSLDTSASSALSKLTPSNYEQSGILFVNGDGKFARSNSVNQKDPDNFGMRAQVQKGHKIAGIFHTHSGEDEAEQYFSPHDIEVAEQLKVPSYIRFQDGTIRKYVPGQTKLDTTYSPSGSHIKYRTTKGEIVITPNSQSTINTTNTIQQSDSTNLTANSYSEGGEVSGKPMHELHKKILRSLLQKETKGAHKDVVATILGHIDESRRNEKNALDKAKDNASVDEPNETSQGHDEPEEHPLEDMHSEHEEDYNGPHDHKKVNDYPGSYEGEVDEDYGNDEENEENEDEDDEESRRIAKAFFNKHKR